MKSLTQLVEQGYDRGLLYRIAHMPNSPAFRTSKRGKIYFDEDELRKFVTERRYVK